VYGLAELHTGGPLLPRASKSSEFPIYGTEALTQARASKMLGSVHPEARAFIEAIRPERRSSEIATDPLWQLHELATVDKHRTLHLSAVANPSASVGLPGQNFYLERLYVIEVGRLLEVGRNDVGSHRTWTPDRARRLPLQGRIDIEVVFQSPEAQSVHGKPVLATLTSMLDEVTATVVSPCVLHWARAHP
jgi:hypothetical protein